MVSCVYCSLLYPSYMYRQVTEGGWRGPEDLSSQSQKRSEEARRGSDLDLLSSSPLGLADLDAGAGLANWTPVADGDASGPEQDLQPPSMTFRNRVLEELPSRRPGDKSVSAEVRLVLGSNIRNRAHDLMMAKITVNNV